MIEPLLTTDDIAEIVHQHPMTIYRKARAGEIPGVVKLGRAIRFKESSIKEWIAAGESDPKKVAACG